MGYWVIIEDVKMYFGIDVSIDFCEELVPSPHCEEVVKVYMTKYPGTSTQGYEKHNINELYYFLSTHNYLNILSKKISRDKLILLTNKIKNKFI